MTEATPDDLWTPYKHLNKIVSSYLTGQVLESATLEITLQKYKQNFINLLKSSPKNAKSRDEIRQGIADGITLPDLGHTILSKDLVDESIIISDMYNLNEFIALELLCTAQQQLPHHPGLPRGLVAILLYYDGRKSLVTTLKELFQAREGISWCVELPLDVTNLISRYTDSLVSDGILNKIIDLLDTLDITKEVEILSENRALGPLKHHRQVLDLFDEIRLQLAMTIFCSSAQCGLNKQTTIKLIGYLNKYKSIDARGGIDDVTLALLMALLYALDLSVFNKREDAEIVAKNLPFICEEGFAQDVLDALYTPWECEELRAVTLFAFCLAMATLRQAPQTLQQNLLQVIDQNEMLLDSAIQTNLFNFLYRTLLENTSIFKTEFYYRRMHTLLTDFIVLKYPKVMELKTRAEETARAIQTQAQHGLVELPSNLCRNFETLLLVVGKLYGNDQLKLNLDLEYWGPMEVPGNYTRSSTRSVSLFKFIRLSGSLPPILFVPYLKMLAGLSSCQQSARNAFNLLKLGSGVIAGSTTISWDHFFGSLTRYYATLRQEQHPAIETVYRNRTHNRNINPQEVAGLQAVLGIIRTIATNDEVARIALCEHPSWAPLHVLIGLISCSIDVSLKADLLLTLAALAKSNEIAIQIWINLEASQIITTIPSTSTFAVKGIKTEIDEVESRNEMYPLTQATLEFLYSLITTAVPKNLGAGPRKPGLDPYLTFIVDSVFLSAYNRNYKDSSEKWSVAEKCLRILDYFIQIYEVHPQDFPIDGQIKDKNSPPGFHIMLQMNKNEKSDLLKLILRIINETCNRLDEYNQFHGKEKLESCALHCLNIIEKSLCQQDLFFNAHFAANSSILLSGINKMLVGDNHMLDIIKFVTYYSWLPKHSLVSVKILTYIARLPNISRLLLGEFTRTIQLSNEIRNGFVECFETDAPLTDTDTDIVEIDIKQAIINLIEESLPNSTPNLAHYLLGFNIDDIQSTQLQQPGIMDFPSNCMKSLVTMLDEGLEQKKSKDLDNSQDKLLQYGYHLIYSLCFDARTSEIVLRFLRSCNDFFHRHVSALPFRNTDNSNVLNQMTALLKSIAIDLKISADHNELSNFGNMTKLLLSTVQDNTIGQDHQTFENNKYSSSIINNLLSTTNIFEDHLTAKSRTIGIRTTGLLICKLLECIDFEVKTVDIPKWDFFQNDLMQKLIHSCEINAKSGLKLINIKKLHDILRDELNIVQNTIASGQRQSILQETESIVKYALNVNYQNTNRAATVNFLEAWGHTTEILFSVSPQFSMPLVMKQNLILEIIQSLLGKIMPREILPELAYLASSTVLQLLFNLRHCYAQQMNNPTDASNNLSQTLNATYSNSMFSFGGNVTNAPLDPLIQSFYSPKTNTLSLKYILKNIIEWIIISGVSPQKLKINLYAALLNFMHIIKGNRRKQLDNMETDKNNYVYRLDKSMARISNSTDDNNKRIQIADEVFTAVGEKLIDNLCHDCIGGHDICKMLALSCLDMLLEMDSMSGFVQLIAQRGYLAHLVDSLMKTDQQLCRILETTPDNLKALYVYESKMAMLDRMASTCAGAEILLEQRTLGVLSTMKVFDMHPDFQINSHINHHSSAFIPSVDVRYQQILFPALNLCDVILSTLGSANHSAITQIVNFLLSHGDMIEIVLRAGTPFLSVGLLQELAAITGLVARTSNQELFALIDPSSNNDLGAHLYRLQKLMLNLFPRFIVSEATIKEMNKTDDIYQSSNKNNKSENVKYFLQIASNLALYARNAIANHSADHRTTYVLFSPSINEDIQSLHRNNIRSGRLDISPSIGIVIWQLKNCVEYYNREKHFYDGMMRQKNILPSTSLDSTNLASVENITEKLAEKRNELKLIEFLTEHCLYLLWAHLDFYVLRAIPINTHQMGYNLSHASSKISSEDVNVLKKQLIKILNETFCEQLLAITQHKSITDKGFVEALLQRIKRLVQFTRI